VLLDGRRHLQVEIAQKAGFVDAMRDNDNLFSLELGAQPMREQRAQLLAKWEYDLLRLV
jgi:hypothetical protein